ncbi:carcinine transporter-like [Limulus polyphemus]|uniref:Carcinine transporter-like n=1 Tax=Limulus polyphemus TaxID=6850 RepID=A0ABM1BRB7_LIMPO|nr:carcinine transporter-like [Limulus polyphemus]XP_022255441.1 carcinine transporter-like [Limulus polyphemus]XP_022255442.1 carcinine transporter-like [Limulus polyphemus]
MDFNQALKQVGDFGLYQKLLCAFLIFPSAALCALVYFTQFFIIMVPNHWCYVEQPGSSNFTLEEWKNLTLPKGTADAQHTYQQCKQYNVNVTEIQQNVSVGYPLLLEDVDVVPCQNGWEYDFSSLYPTLATELNWVCENDRLPYWVQTVFYVGTSVGSIVFGFISDRYGRRASIIASYAIALVAGIGSSFANSFAIFAALRFFVGACIIPLSEDPYILGLEYIGVEKRTLGIICWTTGYITFSVICPWISYGIRDWQILSIITMAPLSLFVLFGKWIPESASWLLTRGRIEDAAHMLRTVAKVNRNHFTDNIFQDLHADKDGDIDMDERHLTILDLFRTPRLRKHSFIMAVAWFVTYCCYHTNTQNTSNLGTDIYDSFTYGALVEVPAMLLILFGLDLLGRRWPMVLATALAGLFGLLIMGMPESSPQSFLGLALVMRVTITTEYNIIMQYSAEIYPTSLRGRGLAVLRVMGTLGLYLSPTIVYLALHNPALPLLVSGIMMLIVTVLTLFLPETLHKNLPHTLEEGENFGKDQRIWECPCLDHKKNTQEHPSLSNI